MRAVMGAVLSEQAKKTTLTIVPKMANAALMERLDIEQLSRCWSSVWLDRFAGVGNS
jgi:hypothetical protein